MNAHVRPFSPYDAASFEVMDRRKRRSVLSCLSSDRNNFGGASARFGVQSLHQFFRQGVQAHPHQIVSQQLAKHKASMEEKNLIGTQKNGLLQNSQKPKAADFVAEAAEWADRLTQKAEQTHGSKEAALEAVARKTGVNRSTLWALRYRKPKDLAVSIYMKLKGAYERELVRQKGLLHHENEMRRAAMGNADSLVVETEAFLQAVGFNEGE